MAFDIEKARAIAKQAMNPGINANIAKDQARREIAEMFPDALDEIERLRADVEGLQEALVDSGKPISINSGEQADRIRELEVARKRESGFVDDAKEDW